MNHRSSPCSRIGLQALLAVLLCAVMLGLTYLYWHSENQAAHERERRNFDLAVEQISSSLQDRMASYEIVLRGIKGYFDASEFVSPGEFRSYMQALHLEETRPGLASVSLIAHVPVRELHAHEARMRADGMAGYHVHPAGVREAYAPMTQIEPWSESKRAALGFDLNTINVAREAMAQSAATGQPALSRGYVLARDRNTDRNQDISSVLYMPLYSHSAKSAALRGWVSLPFRVKDIVHSLTPEFAPDVALTIYDAPDADPANRLFALDAKPAPNAVTTLRHFEVGGRTWTLAMSPTAAFSQRTDHQHSTVVAALGAVLSLATGWFAWVLMTARDRAEQLAGNMTQELRSARDDRGRSWYDLTAQAFAVFLPVRSVGVMGDGRTYEHVVALRAVQTTDFMTAHWAPLPHDLLAKVSNRIINEVRGINRVTYDISSKPPATIEWE